MKKINIVKITLDIIMTLIFVLLYNKMVIAGLTFHEIAGLAIGVIFLIHIGLNYRWVAKISANLFSKNIKVKTKIGYVIDVLLLLSMAYIIVSGIFISRVVFPNLGLGNNVIFKVTHITVSYLALLLIGIHLGLHWDWVMGTFKKLLRISSTSKMRSYIAKALAVLVFAFGIYSVYSTEYITRLASLGNVIGISQGQMPDKGMKGPGNGEGRPQFDGKNRPDRNNGGNSDSTSNNNNGTVNNNASGNGTANSNAGGSNNGTVNSNNTGSKDGAANSNAASNNGVKGTAPDGRQMTEGKMPQREGEGLPGTNPLNVLVTYLGIVSVIAIITYYIEKLLVRIRPAKKAN